MFTGIIEVVAAVARVEPGPGRTRLWLDLAGLADFDVTAGDSVAVNGVCLTAAEVKGCGAAFDCVAETLQHTTLGRLRAGMRVNVERAARLGGRLGGHLVQGHVDGTGTVEDIAVRGLDHPRGQALLSVRAPALVGEMVLKGAVAVDGVSLTIAHLSATGFTAALVPFTLEHTVLGERRPGEPVNLETDLIGKYVRAHLGRSGSVGLSEETLREHGFI